MAANKHSPNTARFRKRKSQRKRRHSPPPGRGLARRRRSLRKKRGMPASDGEALRDALDTHVRALHAAMSAVIVSVAALRRQNCDIDEDIASVLERSAADRLDVEMERVQALIPKRTTR